MKFKNIKKKTYKKKIQSPSNSRSITDTIKSLRDKTKVFLSKLNPAKPFESYGGILKVFVILIFLTAVVIVGYDLQGNIRVKQKIDLQREGLTRELNFWENFIAENKNFPDAYFQASGLEYKLGNMSVAKKYLEKGLLLDPNSENGRKIAELLNK